MPRRRLQHIYDMARTKSACEGGDNADKNLDPLTGDSEDMIKHTVRQTTPLIIIIATPPSLNSHTHTPNDHTLPVQVSSGCGRFQPKYRKTGLELTAEWTDKKRNDDSQEKKMVLTAERVLEVFRNISDEVCVIMGLDPKFARPDWMIVTVVPVPPLPVRPAVVMHGTARNQVCVCVWRGWGLDVCMLGIRLPVYIAIYRHMYMCVHVGVDMHVGWDMYVHAC